MEDLWVTDFRVEKRFLMEQGLEITGMFDIFNLFNDATVLKREKTQNIDTANDIMDMMPPRVFRFGVRVSF